MTVRTLILLCLMFPFALQSGSAPAASATAASSSRSIVGYAVGTPVYLDDLDQRLHGQLLELEEQAYRLRRMALENEFDRMLLESEARKKGVDVSAIRKELALSRPITEGEVNSVFEKAKARLGTTSEVDAKDRIREGLQRELQRRSYHDKMQALRQEAGIQVLLRHPMVSESEFQKLDGPSLGASSRDTLRIVVFSDYQCPFCKRVEQQFSQLLAEPTPHVQVVYKQFPLDSHAQARKAAEAALCANKQKKFGEYHALLFRQSGDLSVDKLKELARQVSLDESRFASCIDSGEMAATVARDVAQGEAIGVGATPTMIVDREVLRGLPPAGELEAAVHRALLSRTTTTARK